jgi:hypothetical protein
MLTVLACLGVFLAAPGGNMNASATATVEKALDGLADPAVTSDEKDQARRTAVGLGKDAIPGLLAHLQDARVVDRRDAANRQGLPPNLPPPAPIWVDHTVGQVCVELLYAVITPSLPPTDARPFKPYSTSVLRVDDWKKWWAHNQHKSLAQIHADLRPLVERWRATHGTQQVVPLDFSDEK